jgi:hypothetical protein
MVTNHGRKRVGIGLRNGQCKGYTPIIYREKMSTKSCIGEILEIYLSRDIEFHNRGP